MLKLKEEYISMIGRGLELDEKAINNKGGNYVM